MSRYSDEMHQWKLQYIYIYTYIHMHIVYIHMYVHMYIVHIYIYIYRSICIYTHMIYLSIYIYIQTIFNQTMQPLNQCLTVNDAVTEAEPYAFMLQRLKDSKANFFATLGIH